MHNSNALKQRYRLYTGGKAENARCGSTGPSKRAQGVKLRIPEHEDRARHNPSTYETGKIRHGNSHKKSSTGGNLHALIGRLVKF